MTNPDGPILCCVDGSDAALSAVKAGLALLAGRDRAVVVAVAEDIDPMLTAGTGMAGGLPPDEVDRIVREAETEAHAHATAGADALGLAPSAVLVTSGPAGPVICELAEDRGAAAIVVGSHGRSGLARAILGSVSDHVVRHAPCPVVVTGPHA